MRKEARMAGKGLFLAIAVAMSAAAVARYANTDTTTPSAGSRQGTPPGRIEAPPADPVPVAPKTDDVPAGMMRCPRCAGKGHPLCDATCPECHGLCIVKEHIVYVTLAEAKKSGRRIWLHVTKSGTCPHCRIVDVFRKDPRLIAWSKHFANVLIDGDTDSTAASLYGIKSAPTDFLLADYKTAAGAQEHHQYFNEGNAGSVEEYMRFLGDFYLKTPGCPK